MFSFSQKAELTRLVSLADVVARRDAVRLRLAENDAERLANEIEALTYKPARSPAKPKPQITKPCSKREYGSEAAAVQASQTLGHTIRAYECPHCRKWHITKQVYDR